ncbi:response regulator transcription factor [Cupriavidus agavae]|uniref:FixJ family two-component response regulator n=1 Tax=Cupriavidus agavae TaxID=1001822 RepID=A0A4Q7RV01_9BURK|nr:response regulator [Cupriavidus agavae]RZT36827.1 FixJ family two-component response regulator [Cupriavidus agavae]
METATIPLDFTNADQVVFVVEDDESVRQSLVTLFRSVRLRAQAYATATEFLDSACPAGPSCLVLDVRLPGISGLDLQAEMVARDLRLPIVFISGHGTVPMTVKAMKAGAIEFLVKPLDEEALLKAVRQGLWDDWNARKTRDELEDCLASYHRLTERERALFQHIASGRLIKESAAEFGISEVTVKAYRRRLLEKMGVPTIVELARVAERLNLPKV